LGSKGSSSPDGSAAIEAEETTAMSATSNSRGNPTLLTNPPIIDVPFLKKRSLEPSGTTADVRERSVGPTPLRARNQLQTNGHGLSLVGSVTLSLMASGSLRLRQAGPLHTTRQGRWRPCLLPVVESSTGHCSHQQPQKLVPASDALSLRGQRRGVWSAAGSQWSREPAIVETVLGSPLWVGYTAFWRLLHRTRFVPSQPWSCSLPKVPEGIR
jgi:hypothetical protein